MPNNKQPLIQPTTEVQIPRFPTTQELVALGFLTWVEYGPPKAEAVRVLVQIFTEIEQEAKEL